MFGKKGHWTAVWFSFLSFFFWGGGRGVIGVVSSSGGVGGWGLCWELGGRAKVILCLWRRVKIIHLWGHSE